MGFKWEMGLIDVSCNQGFVLLQIDNIGNWGQGAFWVMYVGFDAQN